MESFMLAIRKQKKTSFQSGSISTNSTTTTTNTNKFIRTENPRTELHEGLD